MTQALFGHVCPDQEAVFCHVCPDTEAVLEPFILTGRRFWAPLS